VSFEIEKRIKLVAAGEFGFRKIEKNGGFSRSKGVPTVFQTIRRINTQCKPAIKIDEHLLIDALVETES
jgi:hypothetical protein